MAGQVWAGPRVQKLAQALYANNPWVCHLCRKNVEHESELSVDHIVPQSLGGTDALSNLAIAHKKCNFSRGNRSVEEFRDSNTDNSAWLLSLAP